MTNLTVAVPRSAASRLRWALADAGTITRRALLHWRQQPGPIVVGLLFPVLLVLMFAYLFGSGIEVAGGGDYVDFLLPGMFVVTMFFGIEGTVITVFDDASKGVTDRFRSMPLAPSAVVAGRSAADMLYATLGLAVIVVCGLVLGWSWREGLGQALLAGGLLLLLRFSLIWVGIYLGLLIKSPQGVAAVQILVWPFVALTNAFTSTETMPGWLGTLAEWNPLSSTVTAIRDLFGNPGTGGDSWATQNAELMALAWPLLILAVFLPLAVRRYRALGD
jgi:ABC-2 type transport system permease protein